jgi:hypothetical protein
VSEDSIRSFYEKYYPAIASSPAKVEYCRRLFGPNMGQQGFAEVTHLEHLSEAFAASAHDRYLYSSRDISLHHFSQCTTCSSERRPPFLGVALITVASSG